jgi:para-nitrobenzyl esterase
MALSSSATAVRHSEDDAPIARTALGDLRGLSRDSIAAFHGVPYAAPPIGASRFASAVPPGSWSGLRDATRHGSISPQLPPLLNEGLGGYGSKVQSEDCLTLTIRTPAPDAKARPVIVWLHGGGWLTGSGSEDRYDGTRLVCEGDLVCVGVNYRLGALGWLHRPGVLDAEGGTSDQIMALRWVRDHIAGFGGDPGRVTVMGQSAGAMSIARLAMLPEARGLFRRVIMQSAGIGRGFLTSAMATELADQFLRLLDIDPHAGDALRRLRAADVPDLLRAQGEVARDNRHLLVPFMPVVPASMTETELLAAIAGGEHGFAGKDMLIGTTADELQAHYAADPTMVDLSPDAVAARFGGETMLARYRARRPGATALDLLVDLGTEETYTRPTARLADAINAAGGNAYRYIFDWAAPASRLKSCHTIELPFVFGAFDTWDGSPMLAGGDAAQMADLSTAVRRAWIAFAHDGLPAHEGLPPWPRHSRATRPVMRFGTRVGVVNEPGTI